MEIICIALAAVQLVLTAVLLVVIAKNKGSEKNTAELKELTEKIISMNTRLGTLHELQTSSGAQLRTELVNMVTRLSDNLTQGQTQSAEGTARLLSQFEQRLSNMEKSNSDSLTAMRTEMTDRLNAINGDTKKQLDEMRGIVGEKLGTTLDEKITRSFSTVNEQLGKVYEGLGEMRNLAGSVGDLKKVLSNVKTRGILGETQLGAILEEILSPEQYDIDTAVCPDSKNRVEFAVKLPGTGNGTVYLPIDSKFPGDTYSALLDAYDSGDKDRAAAAAKELYTVIKKCAKDIHDKYIVPPHTTNFAIMFLPFEGLYAEVVKQGLSEALQREYHVNIAGPTTMAALLNALYMGFRTLEVQKHTDEVWQILASVRREFESFEGVLSDTKKHIQQVDSDLDKLVGVRTRAINKQLSKIELTEQNPPCVQA